jgi:hypothetical protein
VFVTFTNGCDFNPNDKKLANSETSVAIRLLCNHFTDISLNAFQQQAIDDGLSLLRIKTVLLAIKLQQPYSKTIYFGVDEFSRFLRSTGTAEEIRADLKEVVVAIGTVLASCHLDLKTFVLSSMAGTTYVDIDQIIAASTHKKLVISLNLLSSKDQEQIISSVGWNDEWKTCDIFKRTLADMGGLPRAVECFILEAKHLKE